LVVLLDRAILATIPILMVTAYLEKLGDSDKPVDAVVGKPLAIENLRSAIGKLLS
jgi:hypothetical protein